MTKDFDYKMDTISIENLKKIELLDGSILFASDREDKKEDSDITKFYRKWY